ncbi:hypothetical protein GUITHDRAFT_150150 [Guillardia theta CCMP2712]|uniref:Uncharacterized protein n=2 Tax=Guillardia theta TaxID=55529 RepID=L1JZR3_GUITC|nr:hypothetical protein GUITHDRAFT_150150 [Guillardia theta CCMP2712]EKX54096.1 hypothetical protein GUITHDRAFT_150150 [Guillardia theta CCMP2712]|eukprot:XP_005841076.1 hypothetical protein GUITHDRAFT_150150 [Guillardia theta CCMP2712]
MAGQAGNAGGYGGGSMAGASASRQMDPFPSLQPFRGYANPAQLPPGQGLPHPMSFMRPPFSSIHGSGSHGGGLSASDGSFSSQFRAHSLDNRGILSVGSDRNLPGNDKGRAPVSLPLPTGVPSADGGPNGLGPQQAPGYVANIHLLCDLLGGPLGSTGAT